MQLQDAIDLIQNESTGKRPGNWADLGCGNGIFTYALANLLQPGSTIDAIDWNAIALAERPNPHNVLIRRQQLDFVNDSLHLHQLDGILMANSLHYVLDKNSFLQKIRPMLAENGVLLIVEYDTLRSNQWVPYPIDLVSLKKLMIGQGFSKVTKLGERPSAFGGKNMYAALVPI